MKNRYDQRSDVRQFSPGDCVLALLPLVDSPFQAKYSGPFSVVQQVSDLNYLIETPGRRKSTRLCHINLLKPYIVAVAVYSSRHEVTVLRQFLRGFTESESET